MTDRSTTPARSVAHRGRLLRLAAALVVVASMASACATTEAPTPTIRLLTHEGLVIPQESIDAYTASTGVRVAILREPSPAAVVELLSRTREQPVADVVLGIDSLSLPRVVAEGLVTPYRAIEADRLDPNLMVDDNRVTPVSTIDVCLNVDADFYRPEPPSEEELAEQALREAALPEGAELAVPEPVDDTGPQQPSTILDLTRADHADELVIPDPVTDRMGQYFLVALWQKFGSDTSAEQNWQTVARNLLANGALVAPSWTDAYFGEFTQGNAEGERRVTLASAGMPEVTARLRFELPELLETEVINDGCLRVVNYAGIVQGIEARRDAGRLIDTIISPEFQFYLGDDRGSRPARADLIIPELVEQFGTEVDAAAVSPAVDDELIGELVLQWQQLLVENNSAPEQPLGVENP